MNRTDITIPTGGMYQEWMSLIDLIEEDTAQHLNNLAAIKGWRVISPEEALEMGFEELVDWSRPETDVLVLVDNEYLVCLKKEILVPKAN